MPICSKVWEKLSPNCFTDSDARQISLVYHPHNLRRCCGAFLLKKAVSFPKRPLFFIRQKLIPMLFQHKPSIFQGCPRRRQPSFHGRLRSAAGDWRSANRDKNKAGDRLQQREAGPSPQQVTANRPQTITQSSETNRRLQVKARSRLFWLQSHVFGESSAGRISGLLSHILSFKKPSTVFQYSAGST